MRELGTVSVFTCDTKKEQQPYEEKAEDDTQLPFFLCLFMYHEDKNDRNSIDSKNFM